jgi:hypothetical protein
MRVEEDDNLLHASTKYDEDYWNSENIVCFKPKNVDVGLSNSVEISTNILSTGTTINTINDSTITNFILRGRC